MEKSNTLARKTTRNVTPSPGNTKPAKVSVPRARHYQITLNEIEKYLDVKNYLMGLKNLNYYISCREIAPTTGHPHIHIYVQFTNSQQLCIKKLKGAHVECCKGTPQQNLQYIQKDGDIIDEWGEIRMSGNYTIENVKNMEKKERENLPLIYYNIVKKINEEEANQLSLEDFEKKVKVIYIYGESGVGKTSKAKELIREYFKENEVSTFNLVKYENNFWMGVSEKSKVALYDDFRDSHMKPSEFINFIDYNVHPMNIKGGNIKNKYEFIIVTSVQNPENLWKNVQEKDDEPKKQWLRRMKIIHLMGNLGEYHK